MTDRWDTLPGSPRAAREAPRAAPAESPPADATVPPRDTPRRLVAAPSPAAATAADGGDSHRPASPFDHDAPTAKLPAVPKQAPREREPVKKPGAFPVIAGSAGLFFAVAAVLAFQMRAGADPALGKGKPVVVAQATPAPRKVLVRRVVVTRIVEDRPRRNATPATTAPRSSGPAPAGPAPSAPAPAPAAPAPAPAPAAPLTTQSS